MKKVIKWKGKTTDMRTTYKEEANSYKELFEELEKRGLVNYEIMEQFITDKLGVDWEDFEDQDEFMDLVGNYSYTEEDYYDMIKSSKGMAYYQEFEEVE